MKKLAIFITGMVFVSFVYPCLDAISTWFQNLFGAKSVKLQVATEKIKAEVDQTPVHSIGFQYDAPEEEEYDEDEEDDE